MRREPNRYKATQRRAVVVVLTVISLVTMLGFIALAVDLGRMFVTRAELQRAADAAALAGVSAYFSDDGLAGDQFALKQVIEDRAELIAYQNPTLHQGTLIEVGDIVLGTHDFEFPFAPLDTSGTAKFNAVQVTVRRTVDGLNGPVPFFFAGVFGKSFGTVSATAIAATDDRVSGYRIETERRGLFIPFTIYDELFDYMLENFPDDFSFDESGVYSASDDINEITLYPWKVGSEDEVLQTTDTVLDDGGGNFGKLNIATNSESTSVVTDQVLYGITGAELEQEIGTAEPVFVDENGDATTYQISGGPGLSASLEDALLSRVGEVVGFFVHNSVSNNGSKTMYEITGVRFGRIMYVDLHGAPELRRIAIQPVAYTGSEVITNEYADPTNGQLGKIMLVR